uniref:C2H2-type domain-containing protein n=1 Tax=viral metagenome TaxID=1070528 RepID=A0A6C0CRF8_9ZZZZ
MLTCKHCSYETPYKQILTRHMKKKHPEIPIDKPIYECNHCHKSFASSISCKKHEQNKVCQKEERISSSTQNETNMSITDIIQSSPPKISEIVAESDFEESFIKNKSFDTITIPKDGILNIKPDSPSIVNHLLKSPIIKWIKYIGCTLFVIRMIRRHS